MNKELKLTKTIYTLDQLTVESYPQIALAGRSNVGKSSLINCLAGRKKLAKISSSPGKTRSLNFYLVQPDNFYLIDLPGYGYAKCSKKEREKWAKLITTYFEKAQPYLKGVIVLLDSRLSPQTLDLELISYLKQYNYPIVPVFTKIDKCSQKQISTTTKQWLPILNMSIKDVILFSSKTGKGKQSLWVRILNIIRSI
ncbi:MAG: ribosome biogenesis GTP-binding protein YihA/YsxC [Desulfonauticus sp.]|nr:ribosome biogenesis GTP-binding protein YihA/YsxC [Desulfonauticus sp.]